MSKKIIRYCSQCNKKRPFEVYSESDFSDIPLGRALIAVSTLGLSEAVCKTKHAVCTVCGHVKKLY